MNQSKYMSSFLIGLVLVQSVFAQQKLTLTRDGKNRVTKVSLPTGQSIQYAYDHADGVTSKTFSGFKYIQASHLNKGNVNGTHTRGSRAFNHGVLYELTDFASDGVPLKDIFSNVAKWNTYCDEAFYAYQDLFTSMVNSAALGTQVDNDFRTLMAKVKNWSAKDKISAYVKFFITDRNVDKIYRHWLLTNVYTDVQTGPTPKWWSDMARTYASCSPFSVSLLNTYSDRLRMSHKSLAQENGSYTMLVEDNAFDPPLIFINPNGFFGLGDPRNDPGIYAGRDKDVSYKRAYLRDASFDMISNLEKHGFPYRFEVIVHEFMHILQSEAKRSNEWDSVKFILSVIDSFLNYNPNYLKEKKTILEELKRAIVRDKKIDHQRFAYDSEEARRFEYAAEIAAFDQVIACQD